MSEEINTFVVKGLMEDRIKLMQMSFIAVVKRENPDERYTFVGEQPMLHIGLQYCIAGFDNIEEAIAFKMKAGATVAIIDQTHDVHEARLQIWRDVSKEKRDARQTA